MHPRGNQGLCTGGRRVQHFQVAHNKRGRMKHVQNIFLWSRVALFLICHAWLARVEARGGVEKVVMFWDYLHRQLRRRYMREPRTCAD
jgi:hypothetical protein